jgi:hypothetical protein
MSASIGCRISVGPSRKMTAFLPRSWATTGCRRSYWSACGSRCAGPAATPHWCSDEGKAPQAASSAPASQPALVPGELACVYNRSDGRLIGAFMSSRPAGDGTNEIVTVAVDPELDPSGGIAPGTRWEITVPKNGAVRPCTTSGRRRWALRLAAPGPFAWPTIAAPRRVAGGRSEQVAEITGQVDRGHPPAPELHLERVAIGQGGVEPFQGIGQKDLSECGGISRLSSSTVRGETTSMRTPAHLANSPVSRTRASRASATTGCSSGSACRQIAVT